MVVYLPILSLPGIEGKMFHPMAYTVMLALAAAMILSITFVPAASHFSSAAEFRRRKTSSCASRGKLYEPVLRTALNARGLVVTSAVVLVVLCLLLASRMGSEFIPSLDEGDIAMHALRIPGTSLTQAVQMQDMLEKRIKEIPGGEGGIRQTRHGRDCHRSDAAERADTWIMLSREIEWPDPSKPKARACRRDRGRSEHDSRQQLRIYTANSDAFQRAYFRRAR